MVQWLQVIIPGIKTKYKWGQTYVFSSKLISLNKFQKKTSIPTYCHCCEGGSLKIVKRCGSGAKLDIKYPVFFWRIHDMRYQRLPTGPVEVVGHLPNRSRCNRDGRNLGPVVQYATYEECVHQIWTQVTAAIKGRARFLMKLAACEHHFLYPNSASRSFLPQAVSPPIHKVWGSFSSPDVGEWHTPIVYINTVLSRLLEPRERPLSDLQ
jgi:hypothetical protein